MNAVPAQHIKRVVIIGPECTGKSDLSEFLASHYNTQWVPEYARGYLGNLVRPYNQDDLTTISHGQLRIEDEFARTANGVLFCDTNLYVIKIWSQFKYGEVSPEILALIEKRNYDLYLLTNIDIPWEDDPQREHPDRREELYEMYLSELKNQPVPFVEIRGERKERRETAIRAVEEILVNA
ncbi:MAG TPA: ATP-binding protein [Ohtaekwangia sp.]|nr:ATP-binding protein [Ohtaekwangia sp.]